MNNIYSIQKRDNHLKGKNNYKQDLCCTKPNVSDIELIPSKSNTDRSWIITQTQSERLHIKFVEFLFSYR
jgi:hypothetical protein